MATARSNNRTATRSDAVGRWLGILVFVLGVGILVLVFSMAYRDLIATGVLGSVSSGAPRGAAADWWGLAVRAVLLLMMTVVGALIATRGIGLYAASLAAHAE